MPIELPQQSAQPDRKPMTGALRAKLRAGFLAVLIGLLFAWLAPAILREPGPTEGDAPESADSSHDLSGKSVAQPSAEPAGDMSEKSADRMSDSPTGESGLRIELTLRGTFLSDEPGSTHAVIADQFDNMGRYAVGDFINNDIEIRKILADQVVVSRGGSQETLLLWNNGSSEPVMDASASSADPAITGFRPTIRQRSASLIDLVSPQPVYADGSFAGFRLRPLDQADALRRFGLRPDDVVVQINGVSLENPLMGVRTLQRISAGDYVSMTVQRDRRQLSLAFDVPR